MCDQMALLFNISGVSVRCCLRLPGNPIVTFDRKMVPEGNMWLAVFRDNLVL